MKKVTKKKNVKEEKALKKAEGEYEKAKKKLLKLQRAQPKEEVQDYEFKGHDGKSVKLSELFGEKDELILVHNMGSHCRYCTLWADGYNGMVPHLENRAGFVVESADELEHQKEFYHSRNWKFRMVSSQATSFKMDMGFADKKGNTMPGVSAFIKKRGKIFRVAKDSFGPGDSYCAAWHFFDLLPKGSKGWKPQYSYTATKAELSPIAFIKAQSVYVEDQEKAKDFYGKKLGFQIRQDEPMGPSRWIEVAPEGSEACLVLFERKMMPGWESMKPSVILYTQDTFKTYEELAGRGVEFTMKPEKMPMGSFAKFKDLDGNEFVVSDVK